MTDTDDRPLVRSDVTYRLRVVHEVTAKVEATVTVLRSDVARWLECDEADITQRDLEAFVTEYEDDEGEPLIEPGQFDLVSIEDWDSADVTVLSEERQSIVPPSFVPLPGL
ncbi:hypothetical protein SEA_CRAZYRICH_14 [Microbacterium phage CrazyRich]|uniref:Uncharacterized protein n=3 Tax=Quhwahvirus TaxID=2733202 RepID=A0A2U8UP51_9CAUD|nr:hypothetical protein HOT30_gp14 [Microbacterium phage Paschalis]YP_010751668.1 hypothetical protein QDA08_gp14 [Microbacterium phage NoodlelyBoi]QDP45408.1 hypothetical protein SEA_PIPERSANSNOM_15 [Microbacterium phage PiperSansNom]UVK58588.1 hypothetical protein SEA_CRAZYRICH_14 [Microbacterium phage CrazyRich]AWN05507.1 hypothetical protein SEA_PASCHALIS_14 [Microbacterium phage Paschalis]QSM01209.1 hypothetical protein SEA_NOODLELYBOI_14 [Microbacterium phage NoodlelyBoi]